MFLLWKLSIIDSGITTHRIVQHVYMTELIVSYEIINQQPAGTPSVFTH